MGSTRKIVALVASAVAALGIAGTLGVGVASAGTTTYTKATVNGAEWQYAASSNTVSAHNEFSNSPLSYSDASQTLGANGVDITTSNSADAGVVVFLGRLDKLFDAGGQFTPPKIVGSGLEGYNLYFDTSASGTYLGFPGGSGVYLDHGPSSTPPFDGTNKAALGAINNTSDNADFCVWGDTQNNTVIPTSVQQSCTGITMEQVKLDFASNPNGDTNPLVWAWIGLGDGVSSATGYVTSVDGQDLVNAVTSTPSPSPSPSRSTTSYPKGGVQTGGGKPGASAWLPFGIGLSALAVLIGTGGVVALRRQHQGR